MTTVYLAGGTHSGWQDRALAVPQFTFYDPRTLRDLPLEQVARIERDWLDDSSIVLAYMEKTNPSGVGLAAEVGYAAAQGKVILFVNETSNHHFTWLLYFSRARFFRDLEDALSYMKGDVWIIF